MQPSTSLTHHPMSLYDALIMLCSFGGKPMHIHLKAWAKIPHSEHVHWHIYVQPTYGVRNSDPRCTVWHSLPGTPVHPCIKSARYQLIITINNNHLECTKVKKIDHDQILCAWVVNQFLAVYLLKSQCSLCLVLCPATSSEQFTHSITIQWFWPESAGIRPRDSKSWVFYLYSMSPVCSTLKTKKFMPLLVSGWDRLLLQDWDPHQYFIILRQRWCGPWGFHSKSWQWQQACLCSLGVLFMSPPSQPYPQTQKTGFSSTVVTWASSRSAASPLGLEMQLAYCPQTLAMGSLGYPSL